MPLSLADALRQVRDDIATLLEPEPLRQLCRDCGHRWRDRILDPVTTIHLFLLQVLHGNTACTHLPRLSGIAFTASAYCQARSRLPLAVLQALLRRLVETCQPLTDTVRALARPPHLAGRRHRREHARHPGAAAGLRPADQPGRRLRLPGRPRPGPVPRRHRPAPAPHHRAAALARDVARRPAAPGTPRRRRPGRGPGLRHVRPPGPARRPRAPRRLPHEPAAGRRLHARSPPAAALEHAEADRPGAVAVGAGAGPDRPGRRVVQAVRAAGVDDGRGVRRAAR